MVKQRVRWTVVHEIGRTLAAYQRELTKIRQQQYAAAIERYQPTPAELAQIQENARQFLRVRLYAE